MDKQEVKKILKKKGVTIYQLCKDLEIPKSTVYDWLNKPNRQIGNETHQKITKYLKK